MAQREVGITVVMFLLSLRAALSVDVTSSAPAGDITPSGSPPPIENMTLSGSLPPRDNMTTSGSPPPRENMTASGSPPPRENMTQSGSLPPRENMTPGSTPPRENMTTSGSLPPRENMTPSGSPPPSENMTPRGSLPPRENMTPSGSPPPREDMTPSGSTPPKENMPPSGSPPTTENITPSGSPPPEENMTPRGSPPPGEDVTPSGSPFESTTISNIIDVTTVNSRTMHSRTTDSTQSNAPKGLHCFVCATSNSEDTTCLAEQSQEQSAHRYEQCDLNYKCWVTTFSLGGAFSNFSRSCETSACPEDNGNADYTCLQIEGGNSTLEKCTRCCSEDHCNDGKSSAAVGQSRMILWFVIVVSMTTINELLSV